jgi:hypothetical protein
MACDLDGRHTTGAFDCSAAILAIISQDTFWRSLDCPPIQGFFVTLILATFAQLKIRLVPWHATLMGDIPPVLLIVVLTHYIHADCAKALFTLYQLVRYFMVTRQDNACN